MATTPDLKAMARNRLRSNTKEKPDPGNTYHSEKRLANSRGIRGASDDEWSAYGRGPRNKVGKRPRNNPPV